MHLWSGSPRAVELSKIVLTAASKPFCGSWPSSDLLGKSCKPELHAAQGHVLDSLGLFLSLAQLGGHLLHLLPVGVLCGGRR